MACVLIRLIVFPAQAGVILDMRYRSQNCQRIPRASGGDPVAIAAKKSDIRYSPRKRG